MNSKFAQLTDGLYIAERQSRKELEERNKIMKSIAYREQQEKEEELRRKAAEARAAKNSILQESVALAEKELTDREKDEARIRDELRYIRKRELERDQRLEVVFNFRLFIFDRLPAPRSPRLSVTLNGTLARRSRWGRHSRPLRS